jgi:activating signal cointegrator complex subunit 3
LLHDERGSVIETIVARTLRQVESSQKMIRIIGLSATLPNYLDVARFLNVNPSRGLFFFDSRFRPVPLAQTFIGVKSLNKMKQLEQMDEVCYERALKMVKNEHQVMVFVHARNATVKTAMKMRDMAKNMGEIELFRAESNKAYGECQRQMSRKFFGVLSLAYGCTLFFNMQWGQTHAHKKAQRFWYGFVVSIFWVFGFWIGYFANFEQDNLK